MIYHTIGQLNRHNKTMTEVAKKANRKARKDYSKSLCEMHRGSYGNGGKCDVCKGRKA